MGKSINELLRKASSSLSRKDYAVAIKIYGEILSKYPSNKKAAKGLSQAKKHHLESAHFSPAPADTLKHLHQMLQQENFTQVIREGAELTNLYPNSMALWNILGDAYFKNHNHDLAEKAYKHSINILPDFPQNYVKLSKVLFQQNKISEAISCAETALKLSPNNIEAWQQAFNIHERSNNLEKAAELIAGLKAQFTTEPNWVKFIEGLYLWRTGNKDEASSLILSIEKNELMPKLPLEYLNLKAKCHEYLGEYREAFDTYADQNQHVKLTHKNFVQSGNIYFDESKKYLKSLKSIDNCIQQSTQSNFVEFNIAFLVGFPRSGTTLLDTILRSHSKISVLEERPMLQATVGYLNSKGYKDFSRFDLPEPMQIEAANIYFENLEKEVGNLDRDITYVDKLPLNLLSTPLISKIFPNAKFILALRHPMDTVFSCWMQNFMLNQAMANMLDLKRAADLYCVAMETFDICRKVRNLNVCEIRYENIIQDLQNESQKALRLLGLDWEDAMNSYQKTALKRGAIRTPSYSQVVQPLYQDANQRWRHYEPFLTDEINTLKPWIDKYGYSI